MTPSPEARILALGLTLGRQDGLDAVERVIDALFTYDPESDTFRPKAQQMSASVMRALIQTGDTDGPA